MAFTVYDFLNKPRPTIAPLDQINPPLPFPQWQATGTPTPMPVAQQAMLWNNARANNFPPRRLVEQPRRNTVIA